MQYSFSNYLLLVAVIPIAAPWKLYRNVSIPTVVISSTNQVREIMATNDQ